MIQPKAKTAICKDRRSIFSVILNILIVVFAAVGTVIMLSNQGDGTGLASSGITNLKYFTVLSNEFCGITAALWLVFFLLGKKFPPVLKLTAASAVALTFLIIAAFLAPMYPELDLYENANLWFHLILPLTAVLEFIILRTDEKIPFRYTVISALPALIYGIGYLANILLNGKGERHRLPCEHTFKRKRRVSRYKRLVRFPELGLSRRYSYICSYRSYGLCNGSAYESREQQDKQNIMKCKAQSLSYRVCAFIFRLCLSQSLTAANSKCFLSFPHLSAASIMIPAIP